MQVALCWRKDVCVHAATWVLKAGTESCRKGQVDALSRVAGQPVRPLYSLLMVGRSEETLACWVLFPDSAALCPWQPHPTRLIFGHPFKKIRPTYWSSSGLLLIKEILVYLIPGYLWFLFPRELVRMILSMTRAYMTKRSHPINTQNWNNGIGSLWWLLPLPSD